MVRLIYAFSRFEDQTEPVFLDISSSDGVTISRMKVVLQVVVMLTMLQVYLFNHGKCQQLQGREPAVLVAGFLKYLRKYYPAPRCCSLWWRGLIAPLQGSPEDGPGHFLCTSLWSLPDLLGYQY